MRRALLGTLLGLSLLAAPAQAAPVPLPALPGTEAEPNDTTATATPITSGSRTRGDVFPFGDEDVYSFTAQAGDRVFTHVVTQASAGTTNAQLTLLASNGTTVIETDDNDGELAVDAPSIAGAEIPTGGTYYLRVTSSNTTRGYDLYLQTRSGVPVPETEPNNFGATANPLGGGYVSGTAGPGGSGGVDFDNFAVTLGAGDTISISLDLDPERDGVTWDGGINLANFGDDDNVAFGSEGAAGDAIPSEAFAYTVKTAGTYYVSTYTLAGSLDNTYRLSAFVIPAATPDCRTYAVTAGALNPDTSTFGITVGDAARAQRVAVDLDLTHPRMQDLDISLRSPEGREVALTTDIGGGDQTRHVSVLDQYAATSPFERFLKAQMLQPEPESRLTWFDGVRTSGTWTLVVRDDTPGEVGVLNAASLVLCPQPEGNRETVFAADFDTDDGGFTHSGTGDEWERGTPGTPSTSTANPVAGLNECAGGSGCWKTDLDGTYEVSSSQTLLSPPIDLTGRSGRIDVSWEQWHQLENAQFDRATVSVEEAGGANVRELWSWRDATPFATVGVASTNVPTAVGWSRRQADISAYAGKTVRLRFRLDADVSIQFAGLAIDDVRVTQPLRELTVTTDGTGGGGVNYSEIGTPCGTGCSRYVDGTTVILTAAPNGDSDFAGWGGACSGTGACTVTMDQARSVTATFTTKPTLTVTKTGSGSGTVTSTPGGIDCGADCTEQYGAGTVVTLTATGGDQFAGWGGACGGDGDCVVTMDAAKTVTARFTPPAGPVDPAAATLPALPGAEAEPNQTTATATPITSGSRTRADIFAAGDVDVYAFTAQAGDRVFAHTVTSGSASSTDTTLTLLAPDGTTEVEFDDDNGEFGAGSSSIAGAEITTTGVHYLRVRESNDDELAAYYDLYLQVRSGAPATESESNNTPGTANPLAGGYVEGTRDASDVDLYSVPLEAGDTISLSLDLDPERDGTTWNGRLGLGPFGDASGGAQFLVVNDPGTSDLDPSEALAYTVETAGLYFVRVDASQAAAAGTYRLSASVIARAEPDCRTYAAVPGALADGTTQFAVPVADTARVRRLAVDLDLTHPRMQDLDLALRSPEGREVALTTDIGSGAVGEQTRYVATLDQFAATPPVGFVALRAQMLQPERENRLTWFDGVRTQGTWRLVVRDDNAGQTGTLEGASLILCPQPPTGPTVALFEAGFETSADGFEANGQWQRGTPATPGTTTANPVAGLSDCATGTGCWKTNLTGTYADNATQDLLSPEISLVGRTGTIHATWDQWHQLQSAANDAVTVTVEDGGLNPIQAFSWRDGTMASSAGSPVVNVPAAAGWSRRRVDISQFAGKTIRLRFRLASDALVSFAGLAIDNVAVTQPGVGLTVAKDGTGGGTVTSQPAGIDCGATCVKDFAQNSSVTLAPNANANSDFSGWAGACTGTGACVVTMSQARSVTATFTLKQRALTVTKTGSGTGTVTSLPAGIDCGSDCTDSYADGTAVTLTATGGDFVGWGGACGGDGACVVTMDDAKTVSARFDAPGGPVTPGAVALPALPGREAEPNQTAATATPITSGSRTRADLFPANDDTDLYSFTAQAGDRVFAHLITAGSANTDTVLTLLGPDGTTAIETDDDNGEFAAFSSSIAGAEITTAGTYYLRVRPFTASTTISYYDLHLQVRSGAGPAEAEPNDDVATANPLTGGYVAGTKEAGAADFYSVTLGAGDTISLSLDLLPNRAGAAWNGRLALGRFGDAGDQFVAVDDNSNETLSIPSEALAYTVMTAGTYVVRVDSAGPATTGDYRLSATVLAAATPDCRTYAAPAPGALADGTTQFAIPVTDAARVQRLALALDLTHSRMTDLDLSLRSPEGREVALTTDIGSTTIGAQTRYVATIDQFAATAPSTAPSIPFLRAQMLQPEAAGRLTWFDGVRTQGTWRLVVRDDSTGATGTLDSASLILCAQPPAGTQDVVFEAGFESSADGFEANGQWQRGTPATPGTTTVNPVAALNECATGTGCFKTNLTGTYANNTTQDLLSPAISLAGRTGTILASWDQWYQLQSAPNDNVTVTVEDGSLNPIQAFSWRDATMTAAVGAPIVDVPAAAGWGRRRVDISQFAGQTIRLRFRLASDASVNYAGLAIDNVSVTQPGFGLTVVTDGTGGGSVSSAPAGIDCGGDCAQTYAAGREVTLTPAPNARSDFAGWAGACTGTGACVVTMSEARSVTATFTLKQRALTVTKTGSGTVTSAPGGIDCGDDCTQDYTDGASVTLTAVPATGSSFTGWSGDCAGTATATVTMDAAKTCAAAFTVNATPTPTATASPTATAVPTGTPTASPSPAPSPTVTMTANKKRVTLALGCGGPPCTVAIAITGKLPKKQASRVLRRKVFPFKDRIAVRIPRKLARTWKKARKRVTLAATVTFTYEGTAAVTRKASFRLDAFVTRRRG